MFCDDCFGQYDHDRYQAFIEAGRARDANFGLKESIRHMAVKPRDSEARA
jgi:hypothetical protein